MATFEDIPRLDLYPADETTLLPQLYSRIAAASEGQLNDFSAGSPLTALAEGQVWASLELLWHLNQLPESLALEVLRLAGVSRSIGTRAVGELTFLLTTPLAEPFILYSGYIVPFTPIAGVGATGSDGYQLQDTLYIAPGTIEGTVRVESTRVGSAYNRPAFGMSVANLGLAYVQAVYNPQAITGGSDLEPLESMLRRAQIALRDRKVLVSAADYERKSQELLGNGSRAFALPLLSSDRETEKPGHVHVFLLTAEKTAPSTANTQAIQSALRELSFAGSSVWVSPVSIHEIRVDLTVGVPQLSQDTAEAIKASIDEYLSPFSFPLGGTIKHSEMIYAARKTPGVTEVTDLLIQTEPLNYEMPLRYSFPVVGVASVTQVDPSGRVQVYDIGSGMVDTD